MTLISKDNNDCICLLSCSEAFVDNGIIDVQNADLHFDIGWYVQFEGNCGRLYLVCEDRAEANDYALKLGMSQILDITHLEDRMLWNPEEGADEDIAALRALGREVR